MEPSVFEDDKLYSDAQITSTFSVSESTLPNWRKHFHFPSGDLYGRLRRTAGWDINAWMADRPAEKAQLAPGMGVPRGRPSKIPVHDLTPNKQTTPPAKAGP